MSADRASLYADCRGAAAIEAAFTIPVMILILIGGIQLGLAQHSASSMSYALEKGARALVIKPTMEEPELKTVVLSHLGGDLNSKVTVSLATSTSGGSTVATITGTYTGQIGLPDLVTLPFKTSRTVTTPLPDA